MDSQTDSRHRRAGNAGTVDPQHATVAIRRADATRTIELWTDPARGLKVIDPTGRGRHISCGAALLHARLAAAGRGLGGEVTVLPDPAEPDHLADLELHAVRPQARRCARRAISSPRSRAPHVAGAVH